MVAPSEEQRPFIAEQEALPLGHVNAIDGPVKGLVENDGGDQREDDHRDQEKWLFEHGKASYFHC